MNAPPNRIEEIRAGLSRSLFFVFLLTAIFCAGCATTEFDATVPPGGQPVRVNNNRDVPIPGDPLQYRMRADEGYLVLWIDNPTNSPVELLGKSTVTDPEGDTHPLAAQTIAPHSSVKEIYPPMVELAGGDSPAGGDVINPYDRPGFISTGTIEGPTDRHQTWQWDDELEIQLNLVFQQGGREFEQHFSVRKVRK